MFHCSDRQKNSTTGADAAGKYQLAGIHELYMRSKPSHHAVQQPVYRPRKALNIIRITPRSSAHYNAILYNKIVLAQYRTHGFLFLCASSAFLDTNRDFVHFCVLLCIVQ